MFCTKLGKKLKEELEYNICFYKDKFPIDGPNAIEEYIKNFKKTDKFVIVLGKRYGHIYEKGVSMVERELDTVMRYGKPTILFMRDIIYLTFYM